MRDPSLTPSNPGNDVGRSFPARRFRFSLTDLLGGTWQCFATLTKVVWGILLFGLVLFVHGTDTAAATTCTTTDTALLSQVEAKIQTHTNNPDRGPDNPLTLRFKRVLATLQNTDTLTGTDIAAEWGKTRSDFSSSSIWRSIFDELDALETCRANAPPRWRSWRSWRPMTTIRSSNP